MNLGRFQQAIQKLGNRVLPAPKKGEKLRVEPGKQMLIKYWKDGAPADQLQLKQKGFFPVILAMPVAVNMQGMDSWLHLSRVKCATEESSPNQAQPEDTYTPVNK
jgi:hypothetical protein